MRNYSNVSTNSPHQIIVYIRCDIYHYDFSTNTLTPTIIIKLETFGDG